MSQSKTIEKYIKERIINIKAGRETKAEKAKYTAKFLAELKTLNEVEYEKLMNEYKEL